MAFPFHPIWSQFLYALTKLYAYVHMKRFQIVLCLPILECKAKLALESITTNKASGADGIPVELFQILKGDAGKVLPSICQQIWKT